MVDFRTRLRKTPSGSPDDPIAIYDSLDRASDKGPLRPAQSQILTKWYNDYRTHRDVILKLHTGQGKTIVGLLILQSRLNAGHGPSLYLCPNRMLVQQTCEQARQFGIHVVTADDELPDAFMDATAILVATVQKLFNGLTKFGLGNASQRVGAIVVDDCHACIDDIRESFQIRLPSTSQAYSRLLDLFRDDLRAQGPGTLTDIEKGHFDALLEVPYWAWIEQAERVTQILGDYRETNEVRFTWPLLRDRLVNCQCAVSGSSIEITPHWYPVEEFGSFAKAKHRVFMSATISDDSAFVKGLHVPADAVRAPLTLNSETWSGEKMVLIPSLIHESLQREVCVPPIMAHAKSQARYGTVILTPSFPTAKPWVDAGATLATKEDIFDKVEALRKGPKRYPLVVANRYDGVDLPDDACRVLVLDSLPRGQYLADRLIEYQLPNTDIINSRIARVIEQGMGRAVRGDRDYCVVILLGADLVRYIRRSDFRAFLSEQTKAQIDIGLDVAQMAIEDLKGNTAEKAFMDLIKQSLTRDQAWKEFYVERMQDIPLRPRTHALLEEFARELEAERLCASGTYDESAKIFQQLAEARSGAPAIRGWYLQHAARALFRASRVDAQDLQIAAFRSNNYLLRPKELPSLARSMKLSQARVERIRAWMSTFEDYRDLNVALDEIVSRLRFGVAAEPFEGAMQELGNVLGFDSVRPERQWREGSDNLWLVKDGTFVVIECKSEVNSGTTEISKADSGQMNNAIAWFEREYPRGKALFVMVHPARKVASSGGFNKPVCILNKAGLGKLTGRVRGMFREFRGVDPRDVSSTVLHKALDTHKLSALDSIQELFVDAIT